MNKKKRHTGHGSRLFERIQQADSPEEVDSIYASDADQQAVQGRATFFYVEGYSPKKRRSAVIGGYASEEQAERVASNAGMVGFHIIELQTSDLHRATRIIKARKMEKGVKVDEALENIRHTGDDVGL